MQKSRRLGNAVHDVNNRPGVRGSTTRGDVNFSPERGRRLCASSPLGRSFSFLYTRAHSRTGRNRTVFFSPLESVSVRTLPREARVGRAGGRVEREPSETERARERRQSKGTVQSPRGGPACVPFGENASADGLVAPRRASPRGRNARTFRSQRSRRPTIPQLRHFLFFSRARAHARPREIVRPLSSAHRSPTGRPPSFLRSPRATTPV